MSAVKRRPKSRSGGQLRTTTGDTKIKRHSRNKTLAAIVLAGVLGWTIYLGSVEEGLSSSYVLREGIRTPAAIFDIDLGVRVIMTLDTLKPGPTTTVTLGPHQATLFIPNSCRYPSLWLRLEGDALVPVLLSEGATQWEGSFTLPIEGNYTLVAYWYGCDGNSNLQKRKVLTSMTAKDSAMLDRASQDVALFPPSAWISSKRFNKKASEIEQTYVWHNPLVPTSEAVMFKTSESIVSKDSATFPETNFYKFGSLSNYELVCWIGSDSAELLHRSFLNLRTHVGGHQRPFKFHHYNSTSFSSPDAGWSEATKKKFRKCKHILISMDPVKTPLTQEEYTKQVKNFIGHLLKAFPDETFPIWMFTVLESPINPTNCLRPFLPRTSDHPCNTALQDLFQNSPFPARVRFLDNTDVTLPQLGDSHRDVSTAIALRIFVFVGKQVEAWRAKGQVGNIKGLQRGDHLEPNFELVPYLDWDK